VVLLIIIGVVVYRKRQRATVPIVPHHGAAGEGASAPLLQAPQGEQQRTSVQEFSQAGGGGGGGGGGGDAATVPMSTFIQPDMASRSTNQTPIPAGGVVGETEPPVQAVPFGVEPLEAQAAGGNFGVLQEAEEAAAEEAQGPPTRVVMAWGAPEVEREEEGEVVASMAALKLEDSEEEAA